MKKKLIVKYVFLYLPFFVGIFMFSFGIVNIFSSLFLFLGGYIAIKNTFDYRMVRKNIDNTNRCNDSCRKVSVSSKEMEKTIGVKRTRRYSRVRKRIKY